MKADDSDDEFDDSPLAELPPRTRKRKVTERSRKTVVTPSDGSESSESDSQPRVAKGEPKSEPNAQEPTISLTSTPTVPKRPVGRPPLVKRPAMEEIVELQKQQRFLRETPPFNWTNEEIVHLQKQDSDIANGFYFTFQDFSAYTIQQDPD